MWQNQVVSDGRTPVVRAEVGDTGIDLRPLLAALHRAAREVHVDRYEEEDADSPLDALVEQVNGLLEESDALLERVLATFDEPGAEHSLPASDLRSGFFKTLDAFVADASARRRVADLAFVAQLELRRKREALDRLERGASRWQMVAAADSCVRGLKKALRAVETSLASCEGRPSLLGYDTELKISLGVRRAYAGLRDEVRRLAERPSITERLRAVSTSIAVLTGRDVYTDLRVPDRAELRRLQQRILDWIRRPEAERDLLGGERIWQDFQGFVALLLQVNHREELRLHDLSQITNLRRRAEIAFARGTMEVAQPVRAALRGRDEELDRLLADGGPVAVAPLAERLAVLEVALQGAPAAPAADVAVEMSAGDFGWVQD
jgi:hypothetical protein